MSGPTANGEVLGAFRKATSVALLIGGPRVLRSETAGLVAATIVLYHFGGMG